MGDNPFSGLSPLVDGMQWSCTPSTPADPLEQSALPLVPLSNAPLDHRPWVTEASLANIAHYIQWTQPQLPVICAPNIVYVYHSCSAFSNFVHRITAENQHEVAAAVNSLRDPHIAQLVAATPTVFNVPASTVCSLFYFFQCSYS